MYAYTTGTLGTLQDTKTYSKWSNKKFIQEVKNVKSLSYTSQIKDSIQIALNEGKSLQLFIRPDTYLSGPLKEAIK